VFRAFGLEHKHRETLRVMKEIQFPEVKVDRLLLAVVTSLVRTSEWQTKGLQPLTVKCTPYCGIVTVQWRC